MRDADVALPGAPTDCPGANSEQAGKASACDGCPNKAMCASKPAGPDPDLVAIVDRLKRVKHIVLVLSGKGGVGKSTVSTQLALSLASKGLEVGLLDIDVCGPSVPRMLGLEDEEIHQSGTGWQPVFYQENLSVMSIGFMLSKPDDAVIWRGPKKTSLLKSFLRDVDWGGLDYLVIDSPPGVRLIYSYGHCIYSHSLTFTHIHSHLLAFTHRLQTSTSPLRSVCYRAKISLEASLSPLLRRFH